MNVDEPKAVVNKFDLRMFAAAVFRWRYGIIALVGAVTLLTAMIVWSMQPVYRATATILIEASKPKLVSIESLYNDVGNHEYYRTQYEILRSRELAERVIARLDLEAHPVLKAFFEVPELEKNDRSADGHSATVSLQQHQAFLQHFVRHRVIAPVPGTKLVRISFESPDPDLSALIANTYADEYIDHHLESRLEITRKATEWLTDRMSGLKLNLREAEKKLHSYREQQRLAGTGEGISLAAREINSVSADLKKARRLLTEVESRYEQISNSERDETIPEIAAHPLVLALRTEQNVLAQKLAEYSQRYGPEHPTMIDLVAEKKSVDQRLTDQVGLLRESLRKEFAIARRNVAELENLLQASMTRASSLDKKEYRLRELEREVETKQKLYDMFFVRFQEANATQGLQTVVASLSDRAVPPAAPVKPDKRRYLIRSFMVALLVALSLVWLLERIDNRVKSAEDVREKLALPLFGVVPLEDSVEGEFQVDEVFRNDQYKEYSEAIRSVRTSLMLSAVDTVHQVTLVTSSVPAEGKSTIAYSIASAISQLEKVLLIDADMRRPSIYRVAGFDIHRQGLSDVIAKSAEMASCILPVDDGPELLLAGTLPPNPLELLSSQRFEEVIHTLKEQYDRIIIDTPPVQAVSDTLVLSRLVDAVLYVVKADATAVQQVHAGIERLQFVDAPLKGVVLNQFDRKASGGYGNYYYARGGYGDAGVTS